MFKYYNLMLEICHLQLVKVPYPMSRIPEIPKISTAVPLSFFSFYFLGITIPQEQASYEEYSKSYKCPEYYEHNDLSYYDIESSMSSHRLPQPSAL